MRYLLPAMSLISLALISTGVSLEYGIAFGLITAGAMIWVESAIAAIVTLIGRRAPK